jgi:hypothetical protein
MNAIPRPVSPRARRALAVFVSLLVGLICVVVVSLAQSTNAPRTQTDQPIQIVPGQTPGPSLARGTKDSKTASDYWVEVGIAGGTL